MLSDVDVRVQQQLAISIRQSAILNVEYRPCADAKSEPFLSSLFSLHGKVAVVIGGTGELCGAMAEGLAAAGAEVVIVGRNEEKARARLADDRGRRRARMVPCRRSDQQT